MIFYVVELLDDWNVDVRKWKYPRNLESPRVSSPGFDNDSKMMAINRRSTASDLSRQLSSATGMTVSRQTVYRRLGHIGLYARRPVRCVPLTATHCRLRLTWNDNTRPHRANIVDGCLRSEDITRMDWPAYSPDLNPIEHVWDMLGRRIAARQPPPTCLPELRRALLDEWCNIPQDQMDNLILSMPRRCKACIASSGRYTPY
ncbi:transposable element Tcb1 transposase [Trichonephila clavipes]|uniref:Transposable element Tcb1 transposase n=1 Tax=Trichonephila clavipes TaxID=2585209 RepID=A0A8X6VH51_TRICX|nr:transposable element Tcb1 transposase [Trichonephila clavipes]